MARQPPSRDIETTFRPVCDAQRVKLPLKYVLIRRGPSGRASTRDSALRAIAKEKVDATSGLHYTSIEYRSPVNA